MERLEITEKKRADMLTQNQEVLLSKLELEKTLKDERHKLKQVLDGKGNGVLRDKISILEMKVAELSHKDKDVKTKERAAQKKLDEQVSLVETLKTDSKL